MDGLASELTDGFGDGFDFVGSARDEHDIGASLCQRVSGGGSDTGACPCHERDAIMEIHGPAAQA
jgi:hypothetical protein